MEEDEFTMVLNDEENNDINLQIKEKHDYLLNLGDDDVPPENLWDEIELQMEKQFADIDEDGNILDNQEIEESSGEEDSGDDQDHDEEDMMMGDNIDMDTDFLMNMDEDMEDVFDGKVNYDMDEVDQS